MKGIQSKIEAFGGFKGPKTTQKTPETNEDLLSLTTSAKPTKQQQKPKPSPTLAKPEKPQVTIDHKEEQIISASSSTETDEKQNDSVTVNKPPPEASIAEAKPVALSVAGVGGVASSKPVSLLLHKLLAHNFSNFIQKKVATAVVGPGGLAVSRPVATAIAGIDPDEVSGLGIPIKKVKKTSSATLFNFELANKIKKGYGVGNDESNENREEEEVEKSSSTEGNQPAILPEQVAQVGAMLQPNLDPYKLIPSQFHNNFNIKAPYELIASRVNAGDIAAEDRSTAESNLNFDGVQVGRIGPGTPWMFLPYSYYPPYHQVHYTSY